MLQMRKRRPQWNDVAAAYSDPFCSFYGFFCSIVSIVRVSSFLPNPRLATGRLARSRPPDGAVGPFHVDPTEE